MKLPSSEAVAGRLLLGFVSVAALVLGILLWRVALIVLGGLLVLYLVGFVVDMVLRFGAYLKKVSKS